MKQKRRFIDAPNGSRCLYDIKLKDGSGAQCGRYRKIGDYCRQHAAKMADYLKTIQPEA